MSGGAAVEAKAEAAWEAFKRDLDARNFNAPYWKKVQNHTRLVHYYRNANAAFTEGQMAYDIGEHIDAYIFLKRAALLLGRIIPSHNDYEAAAYRPDKMRGRRTLRTALEHAEGAKAAMREQFIEAYKRSPPPASHASAKPAKAPTFEEELGIAHMGIGGVEHPRAPAAAPSDAPPPYPGSGASDSGAVAVVPPTAGDSDEMVAKLSFLRMEGGDGSGGGGSRAAAPALSSSAYPTVGGSSHASGATTTPPPAYPGGAGGLATTTPLGGPAPGGTDRPDGKRRVIVPRSLIRDFLRIAEPNTNRGERGIETCGVLAGKRVAKGAMRVTTLIIPKQTGGPDTVAMTNEDELFNYCMDNSLLTMGWIHTHPRQECFLSSVDLHTHCGFQSLLPEAIAIVCAPRDRRLPNSSFNLTAPPTGSGLGIIQRCKRSGFHPHDEGNVYRQSGHVEWDDGTLNIVDLR